jgi:hypothetical protein
MMCVHAEFCLTNPKEDNMSNLLQVQSDSRSFHGTQSLVRSSMGVARETGQTGYDSRMMAGVSYVAPTTINMDTEEVQKFDLPPATAIGAYMVAEGAGGTLGTVKIETVDASGAVQATLLAAGDVSAAGTWVALDDNVKPSESGALSIVITPSNGATATGLATVLLSMIPVITAWK